MNYVPAKNGMSTLLRRVLLVSACTALTACASETRYIYDGPQTATVGNLTAQNRALRQIPDPRQRIVVSLYDFPDLTGQYKERETISTLSRAVTQAGTPLLINALQDAGDGRWFSVLDRSSLQDVVQERQIIERMREQYRGETEVDPAVLGPLMHAGIILSGGITGYDTNMQTGGIGARFLGIGSNAEWKNDLVSVSLRAVSTETGEVLASVQTRKTIASVKGQGDVFRFIALDELLEAEVGLSSNEPRQIAVQQAIEKAVMALIAEGTIRGLWNFADNGAERAFVAGYQRQLFNGEAAPTNRGTMGPSTQNATVIPVTRPIRRPEPTPIRVERDTQPDDPASLPPPAQEGEVLG
jgi:curli production assembly/transport component CsgG